MRAEDLELVRLWLGQPHVARWYLAGSTIERELDELRQSVAGEQPTHALVVLARGRPIGWCQWYLCSDYPDHAVGVGAEPGDIGLDYAIGDPARVGKGVGTRLIAALIAHIRERQPASGLIADPQASNIPSRRVLEKNGFRLVREGAVESERTPATMAIYRLRPPELEPRALGLQEKARAFCAASVRDSTGRAVRMLSETPELAEAGFATAVVLGDRSRVRAELERDPGLARRVDPESGWTALHLVSGSRWHWLQPRRTNGLVAVARLLLDAGADLHARSPRTGSRTPLGCATASASAGEANEPLIGVLLDRGAVPDDGDLYMVGFARNANSALRLLLEHMPDPAGSARMALAAPIGKCDTESVRALLEAGADPRRYLDDDGQPASALHAAIASRCPSELVKLLLVHGADPNAADPDGRSAYRAATAAGRNDLVELLHAHGADDDTTALDRLRAACVHGNDAAARRELAASPRVLERPAEALADAALQAAETGNAGAVALMLDLGFPIEAPVSDDEGTLLHAAAYAGSAQVVRLLLERGADLEARDDRWESTALEWAAVGSGEQAATNPEPDWATTVQLLLDAGASTAGITFLPDDPKPPSREVGKILRRYLAASEGPLA